MAIDDNLDLGQEQEGDSLGTPQGVNWDDVQSFEDLLKQSVAKEDVGVKPSQEESVDIDWDSINSFEDLVGTTPSAEEDKEIASVPKSEDIPKPEGDPQEAIDLNRQYDRALGTSGIIAPEQIDESSDKYNTRLSRENESKFREWYAAVAQTKGLAEDPDDLNHHYDYRGFWAEDPERASRMLLEAPDSHFTDTYKKPLHPTFSEESKYSNYEHRGGSWSVDEQGREIFSHSPFTNQFQDRTNEYLASQVTAPNLPSSYAVGYGLSAYKPMYSAPKRTLSQTNIRLPKEYDYTVEDANLTPAQKAMRDVAIQQNPQLQFEGESYDPSTVKVDLPPDVVNARLTEIKQEYADSPVSILRALEKENPQVKSMYFLDGETMLNQLAETSEEAEELIEDRYNEGYNSGEDVRVTDALQNIASSIDSTIISNVQKSFDDLPKIEALYDKINQNTEDLTPEQLDAFNKEIEQEWLSYVDQYSKGEAETDRISMLVSGYKDLGLVPNSDYVTETYGQSLTAVLDDPSFMNLTIAKKKNVIAQWASANNQDTLDVLNNLEPFLYPRLDGIILKEMGRDQREDIIEAYNKKYGEGAFEKDNRSVLDLVPSFVRGGALGTATAITTALELDKDLAAILGNEKVEDFKLVKDMVDGVDEMLDADIEGDYEGGFESSFLNAAYHHGTEVVPFIGVAPSLFKNLRTKDILDKVELDKDGNPDLSNLTEIEKQYYNLEGNLNAFRSIADAGWGQKIGEHTPSMIAFIAEIGLTGGASAGIKKGLLQTAGKGLAKAGATRGATATELYLQKVLKRAGEQTAEQADAGVKNVSKWTKGSVAAMTDAVASLPRAGIMRPAYIAEDVVRRMTPTNTYYFDSQSGRYINEVDLELKEDFYPALVKSWLIQSAELYTEELGFLMTDVAKLATPAVKKILGDASITGVLLADRLGAAGFSKSLPALKKIAEKYPLRPVLAAVSSSTTKAKEYYKRLSLNELANKYSWAKPVKGAFDSKKMRG
jgi:hypothetical protein